MRVDDYLAAANPEAIALIGEDGQALSYRALSGRVDAAAVALQAQGLRFGQRALLVGENSVDMVVGLFATIRLGAWAVPLNARMAPGEIAAIREHCDPRLAYFSAASPDALAHATRWGGL